MTQIIDPSEVARNFRAKLRDEIKTLDAPLKLVGFLSSDYSPSVTYANYTRVGCEDVGIQFDLRRIDRLQLEEAIDAANADKKTHGIIVYYPVFNTDQDNYIKDVVDPSKDIEGLNSFWARKLYHNDRYVDAAHTKKAILPCTPLAIVKLLEVAGEFDRSASLPLKDKIITIFNRSEVVGRPLASMLANDGATVYSYDLNGVIGFRKQGQFESTIARREALAASDIVITGVPSREFALVSAKEIKDACTCVNFSTFRNFAEDIQGKARCFVPRVGPMTVSMALRNTLRLYHNYHS